MADYTTTALEKKILSLYLNEQKIPFQELKDQFLHVGENGLIYRNVPFWVWNGELDPQEVRRQIREFKNVGLAGFFIHGRTGLITPYLSPRWMECVEASIEEAEKVGMHAWLYDENGFPSGSADGRVAAAGEEYQRKILRCSEESPDAFKWGPTTVAVFAVQGNGQFKNLRRLTDEETVKSLPEGTTILHFFYEARGYVDVLSKKAIRRFIDLTYEHYWQVFGDKFGKEIPGIFTDEPSYGLLPWSFDLPGRFKQTNGYDICEILPALFYRVENYQKARHDYWSTVLDMYVEAYMEQIGSWCTEHGIALTGHIAWAETLMGQMTFHAASMPSYEFMHIPGTNHLGMRLMNAMREKQVTSVARQMGGRRVICEIAGGMGWGVRFEELKWVTEWQLVLGVNLLCQHMHHYTLHGHTKRDIPPSYSYQQPWWDEYKMLNDYFTRLIFMLTQGQRTADILIIHPISSAWILFDGSDIAGGTDTHGGQELIAYNDRQNEICNAMLSIHRDFDYGDERIISRHGKVEGKQFIVGDAAYRIVILPELLSIRSNTLRLLKEFVANGGIVVSIGKVPQMVDGVPSDEPAAVLANAYRIDVPPWPRSFQKAGRFEQPRTWSGTRQALKRGLDKIIAPSIEVLDEQGQSIEHIWCHQRELDEGRQLVFLVNFSREKTVKALVRLKAAGGELTHWDASTAKIFPLAYRQDGKYLVTELIFQPVQSYLLILDSAASKKESLPPNVETPVIGQPFTTGQRFDTPTDVTEPSDEMELTGSWIVETNDLNVLTIDWCRWALGKDELSAPEPTAKVWAKLRNLRDNPEDNPDLRLEYSFSIVPEAVIDLSSIILVVETPQLFTVTVNGYPVSTKDHGWWHDIAFRKILIGDYVQSGTNIVRLMGKLTPRTEIESIYIIGDFGVKSLSSFWVGDRRTVLTKGPFVICERPTTVQSRNLAGCTDLTSQGYWFYAGNVKLTQLVDLPREWFDEGQKKQIWLELDPPNAVLVRAFVNGKDAGVRAWRPYCFDVTELLKPGQNEVALELFGSCRNLLGPHHHWRGEVLYTGPAFGFTKSPDEDEPEVPENTWVDRYCFIQFGLSGVPKLRCETSA